MSITESMIAEAGERLYIQSLIELPSDVTDRFKEMREAEMSELARFQLDKILMNADRAFARRGTICQDTGISSYKVKIGTNAKIDGDIEEALSKGTAQASKKMPTIPHSVHPITKINTGDGTGPHTPIIHYGTLPGSDYLEITAQPVGGGGDLCSAVKMFTGSAPFEDVKKFIIDTVIEAGSKPCPPTIIGIGLGGMFESVNTLAKEAVMRPLNQRHPEKLIADLEEELLELINETGIGPMGMGGKTTCLAVNIEYGNTGTYILPVSIKVGCWLIRRKTARLYNDGTIEYL